MSDDKERAWEDELNAIKDVPLDQAQYDAGVAMYRRIAPLLNAADLPLSADTTVGLLMAACATAHVGAPTLPTEVFVELARFVFVQGKRMRREVPVS